VRRKSNDNNNHRGGLSEEANALVDRAADIYNGYAERHGFRRYLTRSDATDKRFHARLLKIGGLEKFELALSVIDTVDFYMGRAAPKPGKSRFRMDIDFLLSEGSGSGDVLAGLIDRALDVEIQTGDPLEARVAKLLASDTGRSMVASLGLDEARARIRKQLNGVAS
jgi:hypothetical protein